MTDTQTINAETERLFNILNAENVRPDLLESGLNEFSAESKNAVARRVARTFEPKPSGKLLGRLPFILTEQNKTDIATAFILNLRSPDAAARKFSLYGLEGLHHAALDDFALLLLRDADDQVVYAACHILLPKAKRDARLWKVLQSLYAARKDKSEFYLSMSFLKSQNIEMAVPQEK